MSIWMGAVKRLLENGKDEIGVVTYSEFFRLCEELCKSLCSLDTNGVSSEMDLLDDSWVGFGEMGLNVCPVIEFQALTKEREDRHGIGGIVKGRVSESGGRGERRKETQSVATDLQSDEIVRSKSEISPARAEISAQPQSSPHMGPYPGTCLLFLTSAIPPDESPGK